MSMHEKKNIFQNSTQNWSALLLKPFMKLKTQQAKLQLCFGKVSRAGHCNLFSSWSVDYKCLWLFIMLHSLVINFNPGHQGLLMGFFSSSVHFDLVGRLIWVSKLLLCACKTRDRDDFQSGYTAWFYVRVMVEVSVNFFFWMCPKRSDYTDM